VAGALIVIGFGFVGFIWLKARQLGGLLIGIGLLWGGSLVQASVSLRDGEFEITTLDVGQGLAMVVSTRNRVLVYDFGPRFGKFSLGDAVVLPHILGEGHRQIDAAVVSHGANDHAGGFPAVLDQLPIKEVFSGAPGSVPGANCHLAADAPWVWDGVRFSFLKSLPNNIRDANDRSCVLSIQGRYASALLTGDIETPSEQVLIGHYGQGLQTDLLQIPHHGSKTSSTKNFLRRTAPRHAVLSRGRQNRFDHPASEVVERYEMQQARIWDTAVDGQVTFLSLRGGWQIKTFSKDWAGFWHWI
jgi:competence protein ComEC